MKRAIVTAALILATAVTAAAQVTVFVVRHAERADSGAAGGMMAKDPDLSDAGRARAAALATVLKDAGITAIYTTELKRTQQTAAPLAKVLGVPVTTISANDTRTLVGKIKAATGNVLVVGHSNTVPDVIKALGVSTPVTLADADYDNLFVVTLGDKPALIRLHYR